MKRFSFSILILGVVLFMFLNSPLVSPIIKGDIQTAEIKVGA
ncbi:MULTISPECIES: hypothetical protein [Bacillus]|nr:MULTISPECIES: hypothetical protein [Bacillus]MCV4329453.1 hypothetical protein [Bacillus velezensis]MDH3076396.1 hypothetical protein [Bacillus velezensis]MDQ8094291.1 hypothetical protein [Bacillus amyloliquefaciens]MEC2422472.1 hypothetical protein [Bacillus velezensis]WEV82633.1 hypothetical protein L0P93_04970 [Bacillus velezensis]